METRPILPVSSTVLLDESPIYSQDLPSRLAHRSDLKDFIVTDVVMCEYRHVPVINKNMSNQAWQRASLDTKFDVATAVVFDTSGRSLLTTAVVFVRAVLVPIRQEGKLIGYSLEEADAKISVPCSIETVAAAIAPYVRRAASSLVDSLALKAGDFYTLVRRPTPVCGSIRVRPLFVAPEARPRFAALPTSVYPVSFPLISDPLPIPSRVSPTPRRRLSPSPTEWFGPPPSPSVPVSDVAGFPMRYACSRTGRELDSDEEDCDCTAASPCLGPFRSTCREERPRSARPESSPDPLDSFCDCSDCDCSDSDPDSDRDSVRRAVVQSSAPFTLSALVPDLERLHLYPLIEAIRPQLYQEFCEDSVDFAGTALQIVAMECCDIGNPRVRVAINCLPSIVRRVHFRARALNARLAAPQGLGDWLFPNGELTRTLTSVQEACASIGIASGASASAIADLARATSSAADSVKSSVDSVTRAVESKGPPVFDFLSKLPSILVLLNDAIKKYDWILHPVDSILSVLIRLCDMIGLSITTASEFYSKFKGYFDDLLTYFSPKTPSETDVPEPQASPVASAICLVSALVGTTIFSSIPNDKTCRQINESLRAFNSFSTASKTVTELIACCLEALPEVVQGWISYIVPDFAISARLSSDEFKDWINRCRVIAIPENTNRVWYDHILQDEILALDDLGQKYVLDCATMTQKTPGTMLSLLNATAKSLHATANQIRLTRLSGYARPAPFVIGLHGGSGVGKTTLIPYVAAYLAPPTLPTANLVYSRCATKYWDRYFGQFCTVFDEFLALADSPDVGEFLNLTNSVVNCLEMASLDDPTIGRKGATFTSDLIITTSNVEYPWSVAQNLIAPQALKRRYQVLAVVSVKPDCRLGNTDRVDPLKARADFSHLLFSIRCPDAQIEIAKMESIDFFKMIKTRFDEHSSHQKAMLPADGADAGTLSARLAFAQGGEEFYDCETPVPWSILADEITKNCTRTVLESEHHRYYCVTNSVLGDVCTDRQDSACHHERVCIQCSFLADKPVSKKDCNATYTLPDPPVGPVIPPFFHLWKQLVRLGAGVKSWAVAILQRARDYILSFKPSGKMFTAVIMFCSMGTALATIFRSLYGVYSEQVSRNNRDHEYQKYLQRCSASYAARQKAAANTHRAQAGVDNDPALDNWFAESHQDHDVRNRNLARKSRVVPESHQDHEVRNRNLKRQARVVPEGSTDPNASDIVNHSVSPALVKCTTFCRRPTGTDLPNSLNGMMVVGRWMLAPRHLFIGPKADGSGVELCPDGMTITVTTTDALTYTMPVKVGNCVPLISSSGNVKDSVLYLLDAKINAYKDRRHLFIQDGDLAYMGRFDASLVTLRDQPTSRLVSAYLDARASLYSYLGEKILLVDGFSYRADTLPGDCGSVLVALSPKLSRKICGIHVCGVASQNLGSSEAVTAEMLDRALADREVGVQGDGSYPVTNPTDSNIDMPDDAHVTFVGTLEKNVLPFEPITTDIRPSPLHGQVFEPVTAPAPLARNDPRVLPGHNQYLLAGLKRFSAHSVSPDAETLRRSIEGVTTNVLSVMSECPRGLLTESEAINGSLRFAVADRLPMDTSAGYPYVMQRPAGVSGKRWMFAGEDGDLTISHPTLRENLDSRLARAKVWKRQPSSLWLLAKKDERRPLSKIPEGKTRVIVYGPAEFTIMCRMYFGAFTSAFFAKHLDFFSAAGVDPESAEWTVLFRRLTRFSAHGFAGDYTNWDASLIPEFLNGVLSVIEAFYADASPEERAVRAVLFDECIHTNILCGNSVWMKHRGNPSGNPLTTEINTICNGLYMLYVYLRLAPPELNDATFFFKNVAFFAYGDDNIVAPSPVVQPFFNQHTVSAEFGNVGLTYTHPSKDAVLALAIEPISNLTFLKRSFIKCGSQWHPGMDKKTIQEAFNWIKKCQDPWLAQIESVSSALRFAYFYGSEYFNDLRNKFLAACAREGQYPLVPDYSYFDANFRSKGIVPSVAYDQFSAVPTHQHAYARRVAAVQSSSASPMELVAREKKFNPVDPVLNMGIHLTHDFDQSCKHLHVCAWCDRAYAHIHPANVDTFLTHPQFKHQCPYSDCEAHGDFLDRFATPVELPDWLLEHIDCARDAEPQSNEGEGATVNDEHGVAIVSETTAVHVTRPGEFNSESRAKIALADKSWNLNDLVAKEAFVTSVGWDSTASAGTVLASWSVPQSLVTDSINHTPFNTFAYARFRTVITFQINASPMHQGRLLVHFAPLMSSAAATTRYATNFPGMTSTPHVLLNPAIGSKIEFAVPFVCARGFVNLRDPTEIDDLGQVRLVCLNPLRYSTGSAPSVNVSVYVRFEDAHFSVPLPTGLVRRSPRVAEVQGINILVGTEASNVSKFDPFGDTITTLQDVIKRYYRAWQIPSGKVTGNWLVQDIGNLLFNPTPNGLYGGGYPVNGASGLLSHFARFFRANRGSIRFKSAMSTYDNATGTDIVQKLLTMRHCVMFTPDARPWTYGQTPTPEETELTRSTHGFPIAGPSGGLAATSGMPFTLGDEGANYVFVEVPFASPYNFLYNPLIGEPWLYSTDLASQGTMFVGATIDYTDFGTATAYFEGWVSAGDEFRFGIYLGPPAFQCVDAIFPDTYGGPDFRSARLADVQGNTLTNMYNFTNAKDVTLGNQSQTGDEIARGASATAKLDKPSWTLNPVGIFRSALGYFSNATQIEHLERLMLHPGALVKADHNTFGSTVDEMDLTYLASMWNFDKTITWNASQGNNTVLMSGPICPFPQALGTYGPTITPNLSNTYYFTSLDAMAMKFSFWRGSLRFRIQVIGTQFHTGSLWFGVHFGTYTFPANVSDATSQYGALLDIQQKVNPETPGDGSITEYDITIPYVCPQPALRVPNGPESGAGVFPFITGWWSLRVINPLVNSSAVSTQVDVNLWRAGGKDIEFHYLGANNTSIRPIS